MNETERRAARCDMLLNRRKAIESRFDTIIEERFEDNIPAYKLESLNNEFRNLAVEIENIEHELKTVYKISI